ncbi:MAG: hypothetical protein IJW37_05995 [Lachnospiraceae bacterium]|nr:hypothetical protein [Lachnospiraceae bacterium]
MKIAVWSPTPYAGRKSSHLLLMALQAAKEGEEQLVLHADPTGSGPEHFLLSGRNRNRMMEQREFGIEQLEHCLRCERFEKELVINSAYSFAEGKLHVLPAGGRFFYQGREEAAADAVVGMMRRAEACFGQVWVEVPGGESEISKRVLAETDAVVINFPQSPVEVLRAMELPRYEKEFFIIGAYERRSIYTKHNLALLHARLQGNCAVIPYEARFAAACCAGDTEAFWERGSKQGEEESVYPFFREAKRAYVDLKRYLTKQNETTGKEETGTAGGI